MFSAKDVKKLGASTETKNAASTSETKKSVAIEPKKTSTVGSSEGKKSADSKTGDDDQDTEIEQWKLRKLLATLDAAKGSGTSMVSLVIPAGDQLSRVNKLLIEELGTASNIKSRVNRLSVLSAITAAQGRLRLYNNKIPKNGLVLYCGTVMTSENKEKKISIDFEPFRPIKNSLYLCDSVFHTEALRDLVKSDEKYGFIIMDGNGTLFGQLSGACRTVLHKFDVDLPNKHGRGGQSAMRFARLRLEKRATYTKKVAELATQLFITNDRANVKGLVLAGHSSFKSKLAEADFFDPRLAKIVVDTFDISYGGENGFAQAITLSASKLKEVKYNQEQKLLQEYFAEIARDKGQFCFGVRDTMHALEGGAVRDLIVSENMDFTRLVLKNPGTGVEKVVIWNKVQVANTKNYAEKESGVDLDIKESMPFVDWLAQNYRSFGTTLHFVSDASSEGTQFLKGFSGVGGRLRYPVSFDNLDEEEVDDVEGEEDPF